MNFDVLYAYKILRYFTLYMLRILRRKLDSAQSLHGPFEVQINYKGKRKTSNIRSILRLISPREGGG
jgi:hypothetical protein